MSRIVRSVAAALVLCAVPLSAQDADNVTAEEALETAGEAYGPPAPEPECEPQQGDEIVVCAREQEQSQFRIRSDDDAENDYARETMNRGDPRAPDVGGPGIFRGKATIGGMCIPGLQKCPPPPAIFVDFSELPEAPPGSDADRVGRGLAPTGNETGTQSEDTPDGSGNEAAAGEAQPPQ